MWLSKKNIIRPEPINISEKLSSLSDLLGKETLSLSDLKAIFEMDLQKRSQFLVRSALKHPESDVLIETLFVGLTHLKDNAQTLKDFDWFMKNGELKEIFSTIFDNTNMRPEDPIVERDQIVKESAFYRTILQVVHQYTVKKPKDKNLPLLLNLIKSKSNGFLTENLQPFLDIYPSLGKELQYLVKRQYIFGILQPAAQKNMIKYLERDLKFESIAGLPKFENTFTRARDINSYINSYKTTKAQDFYTEDIYNGKRVKVEFNLFSSNVKSHVNYENNRLIEELDYTTIMYIASILGVEKNVFKRMSSKMLVQYSKNLQNDLFSLLIHKIKTSEVEEQIGMLQYLHELKSMRRLDWLIFKNQQALYDQILKAFTATDSPQLADILFTVYLSSKQLSLDDVFFSRCHIALYNYLKKNNRVENTKVALKQLLIKYRDEGEIAAIQASDKISEMLLRQDDSQEAPNLRQLFRATFEEFSKQYNYEFSFSEFSQLSFPTRVLLLKITLLGEKPIAEFTSFEVEDLFNIYFNRGVFLETILNKSYVPIEASPYKIQDGIENFIDIKAESILMKIMSTNKIELLIEAKNQTQRWVYLLNTSISAGNYIDNEGLLDIAKRRIFNIMKITDIRDLEIDGSGYKDLEHMFGSNDNKVDRKKNIKKMKM